MKYKNKNIQTRKRKKLRCLGWSNGRYIASPFSSPSLSSSRSFSLPRGHNIHGSARVRCSAHRRSDRPQREERACGRTGECEVRALEYRQQILFAQQEKKHTLTERATMFLIRMADPLVMLKARDYIRFAVG